VTCQKSREIGKVFLPAAAAIDPVDVVVEVETSTQWPQNSNIAAKSGFSESLNGLMEYFRRCRNSTAGGRFVALRHRIDNASSACRVSGRRDAVKHEAAPERSFRGRGTGRGAEAG
jgi:hypothetical protein